MKRVMAVILSVVTMFGAFSVGVNASDKVNTVNINSDNQDFLVATKEDFVNLKEMLERVSSIKDTEFDCTNSKFENVFYSFITRGYGCYGYEYFFGENGEEVNYTFNGEVAKPDPKNRLYMEYDNNKDYSYYKLDADNVDWIAKNIFNVEPNRNMDINNTDTYMNGYYYNGYYYTGAGDGGYIGHTAEVLDYKKFDNGKYYVTIQYNMSYDELNENYMLVGLKNINGKKYWSVYKNSINPFNYNDIKPITVNLNGNKLTFNENPYIENDTTMVPMRAIFEALGASVDYDAETKTITANKGSTIIELTTGASTAKVNGREKTLASPVANKNGTTMVPLRFVSESLGANVIWNVENKTIVINL